MPGNGDRTSASSLRLSEHGAALHRSAALSLVPGIEAAVTDLPNDRAGIRISGHDSLRDILAAPSIRSIVEPVLGHDAQPVRAVLFDKTPRANWGLGWHQDRTVAVRARHDVPGYGTWSTKTGAQHVEPPFAVIAAMVTLRVHLDDVPADNAPLLVAPGSHRLGRIPEPDIAGAVERCGTTVCLATRGDVWAYATPILHASAASNGHAHRRVLQVDYSTDALELPLEWLGI